MEYMKDFIKALKKAIFWPQYLKQPIKEIDEKQLKILNSLEVHVCLLASIACIIYEKVVPSARTISRTKMERVLSFWKVSSNTQI